MAAEESQEKPKKPGFWDQVREMEQQRKKRIIEDAIARNRGFR